MKVIIDCDPGIDDAIALSVLLNDPFFDVKLVTTVAGNVSVKKTTNNALKIAAFFKSNVSIAAGAAEPLIKKLEDASNIHGESGMDGYHFTDKIGYPLPQTAVEAWHDVLAKEDQPITLILTGSYTNFALWIRQYPDDISKIKQVVAMGGAVREEGNMTSSAEFNVFTDPDAAAILYASKIPITMVGLDVTLKAMVDNDQLLKFSKINESGRMISSLIKHYNDHHVGGWPIHDLNTVAYLRHPEFYNGKNLWIDVVTSGPAIGETVADIRAAYHNGRTNAYVLDSIDLGSFLNWLTKEIQQIPR